MVPEGWKVTSLGAALDRVSRAVQVLADQRYTQIGIRSHGRGIFIKEPVYGCELGDKRMFHLEADCLVLNIVFAWEQAVGKTDNSHIGLVASHRFPMYRPKKGACDIEFLRYYFLTPRGKYLLGLASPGGAGRNKTLGQKEFERLTIALPPLPEQRKIAEILSTWDKAIETTEKLLANAETQKRALMQQLLTGKKRLKGFKGSEWKQHSLAELEQAGRIKLGRGSVISKKDITKHPGLYPIYSSSAINEGLLGKYNKYMFDEELITWSIDGGGKFFIRKKHKFSVTNVSGWMRVNPNYYDLHFLYNQLSYLHKKISFNYQLKAHPSVIRKSYKLELPSIAEQKKIGELFEDIDKFLKNKSATIKKLKQEKRALMQQLLTGKRRVTV